MAIDVYLQIDGIKGESTDETHKDWIECQSVQFEVLQPKSATASTGGGHTAERCEHKDIVLTKLADLSTPLLLQNCSSGKTISKAKFEFMRADGKGDRVKYFEIEIENLIISDVAPSVMAGGILTDTVGLTYSKVKWTYTQQKISGGAGGNTSGNWDLSKNKVS
ncbi:MAG: type VI secretion system tube protein Hcp [Rhodoferax sp.]|uniref:Hcp family type VI secretion system effector n=1 Tax=Rhodoferax sp. TaxID=50421 RepID=UPI003267EB3C